MPKRSRTKPTEPGTSHWEKPWLLFGSIAGQEGDPIVISPSGSNVSESMSDHLPGPGPCIHITTTPSTVWFQMGRSGQCYWVHNQYHVDHSSCYSIARSVADQHISLDWGQLPTSNEFGLLQLIAEIDDTVATFTREFVRSLFRKEGLAAFQYGVLPIISDLKAILQQIVNLQELYDSDRIQYEDSYEVEQKKTALWDHSFKGELRLSGYITYPQLEAGIGGQASSLLVLFDTLGFHPDALVAWDLVPLSFLVDWFIPVGSFLESTFERGWVQSVNFNGWRTISGEGFAYPHLGWLANSVVNVSDQGGHFKVYIREPWNGALSVKPKDIGDGVLDELAELPTFGQLLNTGYLLELLGIRDEFSRRSRRKRR